MRRWQMLMTLAAITVAANSQRNKRQLSIDDLISRALSLVRPIFDTSQPLQYDEMFKKQAIPSTDDLRESRILGSHSPTTLENIPLCKGNNRICQFISCSAENFKKDPTFGNLQLAAQVLGDKKLRQAISRFITTIESKAPTKPDDQPSRPADSVTPPSRKENDILMDDPEYGDAVMPMPEERSGALGSKTWSSQPDQGPQLLEVQNFLVASLTPSPPASFQPPTPPPAPPLAFPTMQSLIIPPLLSIDKLLQMKIDPVIRRQRRDVDWDIVDLEPDIMTIRRVKRDYYDDTKDSESPESSTSSSSSSTPSPPSAPDYYGGVAESSPSRHRDESTPLQNCVHILGLY